MDAQSRWAIAIGLQAVDGLKVSEHLKEIASRNIAGKIDTRFAYEAVVSYYAQGKEISFDEKEADIASAAIVSVLAEEKFDFSLAGFLATHETLFRDVFPYAGKIRPFNIAKSEWVLNGASVLYAPFGEIRETLAYDFERERKYNGEKSAVPHIAQFVSGLWQIHPFCEGNTRTTAVFLIKYLRSFGIEIDNQPFAESSWYFRNALVRANGTTENFTFLEKFLSNALLGTKYELKNRKMLTSGNIFAKKQEIKP